eukprot:10492938-Prorocentrum_lima.AAC.1
MISAAYIAAYGQNVGPTSAAVCRTLLVCSLTIPTIPSIKPFDLGWYGGICVMRTPRLLHASIK